MSKKLILLLVASVILCGCSKSAAPESAMADSVFEDSAVYAAGTVREKTAPESNVFGTPDPAMASETGAVGGSGTYIVIDRTENSVKDASGIELLSERLDELTFHSPDEAVDSWVEGLIADNHRRFKVDSKSLGESAAEAMKREGQSSFYSFSNYLNAGVARHDERIISILTLSNVYSGGSGPISVQTAVNLDLAQQKILSFEDVINQDKTMKLVRMVASKVYDKFKALEGFSSPQDVIDLFYTSFEYGEMTPYWYFNRTGVVVFFNQYELGLHTSGVVKVELSYKELEGILLPEYFPQDQALMGGKLVVPEEALDRRRIRISVDEEGERILIGVDGQLRQIQVSEVSWLEGTPIHKQMLFSASHLESADVLEIIGGWDDPSRSIAIEYLDKDGNAHVRYLKNGTLSEKP